MTTVVEVFADVNCPFTHIGLRRVTAQLGPPVEIIVRAWPLEWVNDAPLTAAAIKAKIDALTRQLDVDEFAGFSAHRWPLTTIPALNLAGAAYERDPQTGLAVSLGLRDALFERGEDISDPGVLAAIADEYGLGAPGPDPSPMVRDDYAEGRRREVKGSPDFWVQGREYFCPSLELGHNSGDNLTARFDMDGLDRFIADVATRRSQGDDR